MKIETVLTILGAVITAVWLLYFSYNVAVCHSSGGVAVPGFLGSVVCVPKEFEE